MTDTIWLAKLAVKNIQKRKKRTALTMLGIFIGITAVVALISLGQGLKQTINAQFEKVGADKIFIEIKESHFGALESQAKLTKHDLETIKKTKGVIGVSGILFSSVRTEFNRIQRTQFIMSMPETSKEAELTYAAHNLEIDKGKKLTHKDKNKALIGYNIANKKLFGKDIVVGNKILVNDMSFEIIGTLKRTGDPTMMDNSIILPEENSREILNNPDEYKLIVAQSAKEINPDETAEKIEKELRKTRHKKEGKEDFEARTSTELIATFNKVLNIIQAVFAGIAAISLLVGGIGIMNTMYTAVLERTKDIGIMKAIGARNKDIFMLFFIESGLLGLSGGIIGITTGILISKTVETAANTVFGEGTISSAFPLYLILGSIAFSFIAGTISGAMPARRASKLKPVDALRYE
ncbi:ABC transporter permease [Candidatus Woesearchaeota archaeon]|nr:ABC transporter permease [Candidatus Woesearchaeota archaeon]